MRSNERGSALWFLFIAVALFGALAYAMTQGSRTSTDWLQKEAGKATGVKVQDCTNSIAMAVKRLTLRGCTNKISYSLDGTNDITGAPSDGSCSIYHMNGGGVTNCANTASLCSNANLQALAIGEACGGTIYAGSVSGRRFYTGTTDNTSATWNNGTSNWTSPVPSNQTTDGLANTNSLVASVDASAPYQAAQSCRALGIKWYLPASDELATLYINRNTGALAGTFNISTGRYWSSTQSSIGQSRAIRFSDGNSNTLAKDTVGYVRCVRSE